MTDTEIQTLRETFDQNGGLTAMIDGDQYVIMFMPEWFNDELTMMAACSRGGCIFWTRSDPVPMNTFRLLSAGFPVPAARNMIKLANEVFGFEEPETAKALPSS